jgi:hypothetical protein
MSIAMRPTAAIASFRSQMRTTVAMRAVSAPHTESRSDVPGRIALNFAFSER